MAGNRTRADRIGLVRRIELTHVRTAICSTARRRRSSESGCAWSATSTGPSGAGRGRATRRPRPLVRARMLGAGPEIARLVAASPTATVAPNWTTSMGVTYPGGVV